ncbi:MAG TPA: tetratricopeptide repeat protein [Flavobacteriales bacterium]|nr:tetratricopeptide repeat protein [Flavobacteriales bacterium]
MDRDRLTQLVKDPGAVERADLGDLRTLSERYPWFSAAHLLRAAGEQRSGDVLYDETLSRTAAHVPTRARLLDLVTGPIRTAPKLTIVPKEVEERPTAVPEMIAEVQPVMPTTPPAPEEVPAVPAPPAPEPEEEEPLAAVVPEAPPMVLAEVPPTSQEAPAEDPLERQILEAAFASAYDLTLLEPLPAPAPVATTVPPPVATVSEATPTEEPPPPVPDEPEVVPEAPPVAAAMVPPGGRLRFSDWLSIETAPVVPAPPRPAPPAPEAEAPVPPQEQPAAPITTKRAATAQETSALIDRFIQQETPEPKAKATFFTPQQAAKKSLDDTAGMVTETLARIYEKQGNTAKAIDAYHRLALKYPEKAAYFAALAKALEERQPN